MHSVKRVTMPTVYSIEPYSTQWHYIDADGVETCYIQMNRDEEHPHWIPYGTLLEYAFYDRLEDTEFMTKVMESYAIKE